jgi:predicted ester cyclase
MRAPTAALILSAVQAGSVLAQQPTGVDETLVRANAPKFHKNFSAGDFAANGPLVTEDIDVESNNVKLVGRENFVRRIERYSIPFPGLQLRDRFIVVDGNVAAVNYVLQGEHKGPYGSMPATGNKIEAMSGEVFEFDQQGLMKKLITITELDRVEAEIKGTIRIDSFQAIDTLANGTANAERRAALRAAAAAFHRNFNDSHAERNAKLATRDVHINADNITLYGNGALAGMLDRLKKAFPDMHIHDEYVLADGNRAAVEYVMVGRQTGALARADGSTLQPTGKNVRVRGIDFLTFDEAGLLQELIMVHNDADFAAQLMH